MQIASAAVAWVFDMRTFNLRSCRSLAEGAAPPAASSPPSKVVTCTSVPSQGLVT